MHQTWRKKIKKN